MIQDILEYGLEDEVFASEYIQEPRDIWRYTEIPAHRKSVPIHIKEEKSPYQYFDVRLETKKETGPRILRSPSHTHNLQKIIIESVELQALKIQAPCTYGGKEPPLHLLVRPLSVIQFKEQVTKPNL